MKFNKISASSLFVLALSACVYVPVADKSNDMANTCKTYTQKMTLDELFPKETRNDLLRPFYQQNSCSGDCAKLQLAIMALPAVVAAGSAIISGSIVVIGNSVHWMEYQGRCDDGYLYKSKVWFLETLNKIPLPTT
jgi:hypothetical protein